MAVAMVEHQRLVCPVAERSIAGLLTVTELVVSGLVHIELNWATASHVVVAFVVAPRLVPSRSTRAPAIQLACLEIRVHWKIARPIWKCRWAILPFKVRKFVWHLDNTLMLEVTDVIWLKLLPRWWTLDDLGLWDKRIVTPIVVELPRLKHLMVN
jgi:hypothetical protein